MTLFTNPNFIDHIVKTQGAQTVIDQEQYASLQTYIQLQTRLLLQTAIKFMRNDIRDEINQEDIELAAKENNHYSLLLFSQKGKYQYHHQNQQIMREDHIYTNPEQLFKEEMKVLGANVLEGPKLRGQWIYIKGKIPTTSENVNFKSLSQLNSTKEHEQQEQKKLFNIIKVDHYQILSKEQGEYFKRMTGVIAADAGLSTVEVDGDFSTLLSFFLAFISEDINETGISFLLKVLSSKFISDTIEYNLKNILRVLIAYKGPQSYSVGILISELIERYCDKYPILLNIYENYEDDSYSTILKCIPFELRLGVCFKISQSQLKKCSQQAQLSDPMAILCMRALLFHSCQLSMFKKYLERKQNTLIYWHPCPQMQNDSYLGSI